MSDNELPPKDYLNRTLWGMGHNAKQREIIIDTARKTTAMTGIFCDPIDLGLFCMPVPKLPKQKWYIRLKWWFLRKWREGWEAGRKWWKND
jgi:hypothetical protein